MKKTEFIASYGEDAYKRKLESDLKWQKEHKEQNVASVLKCLNKRRQKGITRYCNKNYDLIENYELAKADNFDPKKWHLHHRLENYWSKATLKRKGLYDNVNPEALIWLSYDEHKKDASLSTFHPELSKWHQRRLERD